MWVIIHNKWDDGNTRTEHIQDAEHLRPLREYLAVHCNKRVPPKKKQSKHDTRAKRRSTPKKQNERQGTTKKKKGSRVPSQTGTYTRACKLYENAPMPASAISSQSSARPSRRRRKSALARCSASTASNSFFLSASRARRAALGGGGAGWEPGAWEARVDEVTDGRMGIWDIECLPACLSTGAGHWVRRVQYVGGCLSVPVGGGGADCLEQSYVAYGRSAGGCFRSSGYNASTACSQVHLVLCPRVLCAETGISCTVNLLGGSEAQFDVSYLLITFYTRGPCQLSPGPW